MSDEPELRRVLVGVDEDVHADAAIETGMMLAGLFGGELQLLHAVPLEPPVLPDLASGPWDELRENALATAWRGRAEHLVGIVADSHWAEVPVRELLRIVHGRPATCLLACAREQRADVVVVGGERRDGVLHLGGTVRALLGKSPCPVWVQTGPLPRFRSLLVPVDMSAHSTRTVAVAVALAKHLGASLRLLHAFRPHLSTYTLAGFSLQNANRLTSALRDEERRAFDDFVARVAANDVEVHAEFRDGAPIDLILHEQPSADLIVIGTHGRSAFARAVLGTLAWEVVRRAETGVLAVPGPDAAYPAG